MEWTRADNDTFIFLSSSFWFCFSISSLRFTERGVSNTVVCPLVASISYETFLPSTLPVESKNKAQLRLIATHHIFNEFSLRDKIVKGQQARKTQTSNFPRVPCNASFGKHISNEKWLQPAEVFIFFILLLWYVKILHIKGVRWALKN